MGRRCRTREKKRASQEEGRERRGGREVNASHLPDRSPSMTEHFDEDEAAGGSGCSGCWHGDACWGLTQQQLTSKVRESEEAKTNLSEQLRQAKCQVDVLNLRAAENAKSTKSQTTRAGLLERNSACEDVTFNISTSQLDRLGEDEEDEDAEALAAHAKRRQRQLAIEDDIVNDSRSILKVPRFQLLSSFSFPPLSLLSLSSPVLPLASHSSASLGWKSCKRTFNSATPTWSSCLKRWRH
eukprot:195843-Hanusia_phi.AAC.3